MKKKPIVEKSITLEEESKTHAAPGFTGNEIVINSGFISERLQNLSSITKIKLWELISRIRTEYNCVMTSKTGNTMMLKKELYEYLGVSRVVAIKIKDELIDNNICRFMSIDLSTKERKKYGARKINIIVFNPEFFSGSSKIRIDVFELFSQTDKYILID